MDNSSNFPNKSEQRVGDALRKMGIEVLYQHKIGRYTLDIFLPQYNVCIEIYGPHHVERNRQMTDLTRQRYLENSGITVYIITAQEAHIASEVRKLINRVIQENTGNISTKPPKHETFNTMKQQIDEWVKKNPIPDNPPPEIQGGSKKAVPEAEDFKSLLDKYCPVKPKRKDR